MNPVKLSKIAIHKSPGVFRAVAYDQDDRASALFLERWGGQGEAARHGASFDAKLRAFADELRGAFIELETGEEAFLRLKSREGLTEGQALAVRVDAEARSDKHARVSITPAVKPNAPAFQSWLKALSADDRVSQVEDRDSVDVAFDEALQSSVTLPNGGRLHIERTRALTAFDIDTAGRVGKGSAAARALATNADAVMEMARHVALRGLGGNLVLDCIGPSNRETNDRLWSGAKSAFEAYFNPDVRVLKPSPFGLMEVSTPWRFAPLADRLERDPGETELLDSFRAVQREADANPTALYTLLLSNRAFKSYQYRRELADTALKDHHGGRVDVRSNEMDTTKVQRR